MKIKIKGQYKMSEIMNVLRTTTMVINDWLFIIAIDVTNVTHLNDYGYKSLLLMYIIMND